MVAIWGHFQKSSASLISRFSTWTQNPSRPQSSKLVSGTQRAQCTWSVWMMQASLAIYRELFCKVLWRWLSLSWVGATGGWVVSCPEAPHPASLQSPHRAQIPRGGDNWHPSDGHCFQEIPSPLSETTWDLSSALLWEAHGQGRMLWAFFSFITFWIYWIFGTTKEICLSLSLHLCLLSWRKLYGIQVFFECLWHVRSWVCTQGTKMKGLFYASVFLSVRWR